MQDKRQITQGELCNLVDSSKTSKIACKRVLMKFDELFTEKNESKDDSEDPFQLLPLLIIRGYKKFDKSFVKGLFKGDVVGDLGVSYLGGAPFSVLDLLIQVLSIQNIKEGAALEVSNDLIQK